MVGEPDTDVDDEDETPNEDYTGGDDADEKGEDSESAPTPAPTPTPTPTDDNWISGGIGPEGNVGVWAWGACAGGGALFDWDGTYAYGEGCAGGGIWVPPSASVDLIGEVNFGTGAQGTSGAALNIQGCLHVFVGGCGGVRIGEGYVGISGGLGIGTPGVGIMGGGIAVRYVEKLKFW